MCGGLTVSLARQILHVQRPNEWVDPCRISTPNGLASMLSGSNDLSDKNVPHFESTWSKNGLR